MSWVLQLKRTDSEVNMSARGGRSKYSVLRGETGKLKKKIQPCSTPRIDMISKEKN